MDSLFIVDDNIELLCLYKRLLSVYGKYDIAGMAGNGRDAIAKYKQMEKKPDLVLMDVNMPEVDGISAAREIHRYDSDARIMFVTAEQIYRFGPAAGARGYAHIEETVLQERVHVCHQ